MWKTVTQEIIWILTSSFFKVDSFYAYEYMTIYTHKRLLPHRIISPHSESLQLHLNLYLTFSFLFLAIFSFLGNNLICALGVNSLKARYVIWEKDETWTDGNPTTWTVSTISTSIAFGIDVYTLHTFFNIFI